MSETSETKKTRAGGSGSILPGGEPGRDRFHSITAGGDSASILDGVGGRSLAAHHLAMLRGGSGIADEVIAARGYFTATDPAGLRALGFAPKQCRVPALVLPLHTTDGGNGLYISRPDNPRVVEDRRKKNPDGTYSQKVIRYEQPEGEAVRVDVPPACRPQLADPSIPLFITEGQKKADALASRGACAIALTGVWNWRSRNDFGGTTFTNDLDYIAFDGRQVYLVFDSDVMTKTSVRQALERFTEHLQRKKAHVSPIYLPRLDDGKAGVDDWLVSTGKGLEELVQLATGPRPEPQAAAPVVELLDAAPNRMTRPLALVGGRAYAATWCWVRVTVTESVNKRGEIVRHDPPIQTNEQRLFVVRDDGCIFGPGGHKSLEELGLDVRLPEVPQPELLLSAPALKRFADGYRPDPAGVFAQVVATVDRFIDFDRSLAGQEVMAELVACYALATWFLDAFTVAGIIWPNGDRGSGKTQLLLVTAALSYLGQVVLAGGSFAALRDMADYGATLFFDDAENITDARRTDPDKRTLLLAGNRRGNTVALKESQGNSQWVTRHVNTFSFRGFSAIKLPDNVLASRTIIIPLIRTPDRYRANADPLDYNLWPVPRPGIVDDLWLLALSHLPELRGWERRVNDSARLAGRNLEPWRAILAVAGWLDGQGVTGLWQRMEQLSMDYQAERPNLEVSDLTALVIQALGKVLGDNLHKQGFEEVEKGSDVYRQKVHILTSSITDAAQALIEEQELDFNADYVTSRRIGRALGKMRLSKQREAGTGKSGWLVSLSDLDRWCTSYGLDLGELTDFTTLSANFTNFTDFTNFTENDPNCEVSEHCEVSEVNKGSEVNTEDEWLWHGTIEL